jgi:hypothetical protein
MEVPHSIDRDNNKLVFKGVELAKDSDEQPGSTQEE